MARMRIVVASSSQGGLEDTVSPQFGRAPVFTIVDIEDGEIKDVKTVQNPAAMLPQGAGIQAAQFVAQQGATHVVAGNFGPNSSMVLAQMGIEIVVMENIPIKEAIERIKSGNYQRFESGAVPTPAGPGPGYGGPGWGAGFFPGWTWQGPWSRPAPWMGPLEPWELGREAEIRYLEMQKKMIESQIEFLKDLLKEIDRMIKELKGV